MHTLYLVASHRRTLHQNFAGIEKTLVEVLKNSTDQVLSRNTSGAIANIVSENRNIFACFFFFFSFVLRSQVSIFFLFPFFFPGEIGVAIGDAGGVEVLLATLKKVEPTIRPMVLRAINNVIGAGKKKQIKTKKQKKKKNTFFFFLFSLSEIKRITNHFRHELE
jgi:hypothetical protein